MFTEWRSGQVVAVNAYSIGWRPKWDEKRFLENMDDEVQSVQELDTVQNSVFDNLLAEEAAA